MASRSGPRYGDLDRWLGGLAFDPEVFLHRIDPANRRTLLVQLSEQRLRDAAFLDDRLLTDEDPGAWVPLAAALKARPAVSGPRGIILHCGHAGSTLVTRLLAELSGVRTLREPLALQTLAAEERLRGSAEARLRQEEFTAALELTQAVYAKSPPDTQGTIVKHTSFTANLGLELMKGSSPPAVLALWVALKDYLATMLRDPGLREGVRVLAGEWIRDVVAELGSDAPRLSELDDAELATLNWTAAQLSFARVSLHPGARLLAWRFEDFLAEPVPRLAELAVHFGVPADPDKVEHAIASPWLGRYAKDPRYPFDARSRQRELAESRQRFENEIATGLGFARALWTQLPLSGAPAASYDF